MPLDTQIEQLINQIPTLEPDATWTGPDFWRDQIGIVRREPDDPLTKFGPSAVLGRLVKLGVQSLPNLLNHLQDNRETKLKWADYGDGNVDIRPSYDARDRAFPPVVIPRDLLNSHRHDFPRRVPVCVGDVCYYVVGEIVNRHLGQAILLQGGPIVESPVREPEIAELVRKDWRGLTETQHRQQLVRDAYNADPRELFLDGGQAVVNLLFYYPDVGKQVALKLLTRELYDSDIPYKIGSDMVEHESANYWRASLATAKQQYGAALAETIPAAMDEHFLEGRRSEPVQQRTRARLILRTLFPSFYPYSGIFRASVTAYSQANLIYLLGSFPDKEVDRAVQDNFYRVLKVRNKPIFAHEDSFDALQGLDDMALACFERMKGKGFDKDYLQFFSSRIEKMHPFPDWAGKAFNDVKAYFPSLNKALQKS